jgi:hypothetical protein
MRHSRFSKRPSHGHLSREFSRDGHRTSRSTTSRCPLSGIELPPEQSKSEVSSVPIVVAREAESSGKVRPPRTQNPYLGNLQSSRYGTCAESRASRASTTSSENRIDRPSISTRSGSAGSRVASGRPLSTSARAQPAQFGSSMVCVGLSSAVGN